MSNFRTVWGKQGPPGTGLTAGEKTSITGRLTALEEGIADIPGSLGDMGDVDTATNAPASGNLLRFDGTDWVPYAPAPITVPFAIAMAANGGSSAPPTGLVGSVYVGYAATVTGWIIYNNDEGSILWDVRVAGSSILGTVKPQTSNAYSNGSTTMTGWATNVPSGSAVEFFVTSVSGLTLSTLNLRLTRSLAWGD